MDLTVFESIASQVLLKWFTVVGLIMYTFFTVVVIKQVGIMAESVETEINNIAKMFAWVHLLMSVLLTVVALVWL
jgi:hypothetical protein